GKGNRCSEVIRCVYGKQTLDLSESRAVDYHQCFAGQKMHGETPPYGILKNCIATKSSIAVATLSLVAATEQDPCAQMCSYVDGCAKSKYDSYCKSWQSPTVCFGLVKKADGSICFEPADADCVGEPIACGEQPTTAGPGTSSSPVEGSTTEMPVTTTAAAAPASTTESFGTSTTPSSTSDVETTTVVETPQ
ncbi:hypothetical protein FOZ62_004296, partial [Perkinsus olseni]